MDGACAYEQKTVIHELTQGIQMAKQLRVNMNSAEARDFLIQKILSSYENALFLLKSGESSGQPWSTVQPSPNFPKSSISLGSPQSGEFEFDQFDHTFIHQNTQNVVSNKGKFPLPPRSPEKHDIKPTHHYPYHHQLSPPNPNELLSIFSSNHSVNMGASVPSPFDFPSSPSGFMEDNQFIQLPNNYDNELLQVYSPPFISPSTSESNHFSEWGSSASLDFAADVAADVDLDFNFNNFLLDGYSDR